MLVAKSKPRSLVPALIDAKFALNLNQRELAERMGSSERTASRWMAGQSSPSRPQLEDLARTLQAVDAPLAQEIAAHAETSLEALGLVASPSPVTATLASAPSSRV